MFFIQVMPEQVNARLAILRGQILAHLPNYLVIFEKPPTSPNADLQVFAIDPASEDVNRVMDGGKEIIYLWKGSKSGRYNEVDLVSVPIYTVQTAMNVPKATPADVARAALADFPEPVRLAGVIATVSDDMLKALPSNTSQLRAWAEHTLQQSVAAAGA